MKQKLVKISMKTNTNRFALFFILRFCKENELVSYLNSIFESSICQNNLWPRKFSRKQRTSRRFHCSKQDRINDQIVDLNKILIVKSEKKFQCLESNEDPSFENIQIFITEFELSEFYGTISNRIYQISFILPMFKQRENFFQRDL